MDRKADRWVDIQVWGMIDRWIDIYIDGQIFRQLYKYMGWIDRSKDRKTHMQVDRWIGGCRWIDRQIDGEADGCIDRLIDYGQID